MRQVRCHVDAVLQCGDLVRLPEAVANHALRVLRLADGAPLTLFNGDGFDYLGRLQLAGRGQASVHIEETSAVGNESPLRLVLAQGIARGDRMDLILQKATELGVSAIWPLRSERTEVRLDGARLDRRLDHWRAVLASACEQSGRATLPQLASPMSLAQMVGATPPDALRLTLAPGGALGMSTLEVGATACVVIAIGPEGGLSPAEVQQLTDAGFRALRLGPRILRTETAGLAALAALQARFGDLA